MFPLWPRGLQGFVRSRSVRWWTLSESAERPVLIGLPYNDAFRAYNAIMVANTHVMTVSQNGQVSIPADTRARWKARQVIVVDLGDRVVMRPLGDDMVGALEGKYRGRGPSSDRTRKQARAADALRDRPR